MFQAAQSLQVPAYEPALVGLWGAGALVHAYAVRATGPLLVGIAAGTGWFVWQTLLESPSVLAAVLVLGAGAIVATALGRPPRPPRRRLRRTLARGRRAARAGHPLRGGAALRRRRRLRVEPAGWSPAWWSPGSRPARRWRSAEGAGRFEPLGAVVVLLSPSASSSGTRAPTPPRQLTAADWAHAAVSVTAYAGLAVGIAALGAVRDSWPLTALATAGLVVFTTFQSFAVFAQIIQGAWLFVVLGLIFLGTGYLFDRARRELAASLEGADR